MVGLTAFDEPSSLKWGGVRGVGSRGFTFEGVGNAPEK